MWRSAPPCIFDPNPHKECKERRICSLVWNRTLFWRTAALNIFIQAQCQILHSIRRKRQLLGWLSCGSVNAGFESEISDPHIPAAALRASAAAPHWGTIRHYSMIQFSNSKIQCTLVVYVLADNIRNITNLKGHLSTRLKSTLSNYVKLEVLH